MISVMTGCVPRTQERSEMIYKLAMHDVYPVTFLSPCDGKTLGVYDNWHRALQYAVNTNGDTLLFEDDGIVKPHLKQSIELAKQLQQPTYFYINEVLQDGTDENKNLYPNDIWQKIKSGAKLPLQAVKLRNVSKVNSALALYLPRKYLVAFLSQYKQGNFDSQLCRWLDRNDIDTYTVIPHAVQHIHGKSYWNGNVTRSKSASADLIPLDAAH